jgi:hypothetical protein
VSKRWIVTLAFLASAPAVAAAQFTTFIAPPNPVKDSIHAAVVAEQKATTDSVTRAQITDMKTWVDSAAGVPPGRASDSIFATTAATTTTPTTAMSSNGTVAPSTASPLPFIIVLGAAAMLLGLAMMRRPDPKPQRISKET